MGQLSTSGSPNERLSSSSAKYQRSAATLKHVILTIKQVLGPVVQSLSDSNKLRLGLLDKVTCGPAELDKVSYIIVIIIEFFLLLLAVLEVGDGFTLLMLEVRNQTAERSEYMAAAWAR